MFKQQFQAGAFNQLIPFRHFKCKKRIISEILVELNTFVDLINNQSLSFWEDYTVASESYMLPPDEPMLHGEGKYVFM